MPMIKMFVSYYDKEPYLSIANIIENINNQNVS